MIWNFFPKFSHIINVSTNFNDFYIYIYIYIYIYMYVCMYILLLLYCFIRVSLQFGMHVTNWSIRMYHMTVILQ